MFLSSDLKKYLVRITLTAPVILALLMGLVGRSYAQYTWQNVVIMGGGFVPGLAYSPVAQGLLYARTDVGGFYRWNNSASQWVPLTDMYGPSQSNNYGGESIAPDPVNPNVVYAAAGSSGTGVILSSTNQGGSWTVNAIPVSIAGNNDGREAGERLAVDPNLDSILYFGSRWQGLWVSANSASSWSQVTSFPVLGDAGYGLSWVLFPPPTNGYGNPSGSASATIYVGVLATTSGNSNLYRSINGGASWTLIPGGPSNMVTPHASLGTDGNLWIVYDSGGYGPNSITTGQIWKLNTSTLAWSNVTPSNGPGGGNGGYSGISVDHENANHALVTTIDWWSGPDKVFSTTNGGGSWSIIGLPGSSYSAYNDNGAVWSVGCGSIQGGVGWAGCVAIDPFNSDNAIYPSSGAAPGGGVWSSTSIQSSPVSWTFTDLGIEEMVSIFMPPAAEGGILFSCMGDVGGMRHTNLTLSPASGMYCNPQYSNTNMLDFAENNTNDVVRVGNSNTSTSDDVAYSTNNGQSWTPWGSAPPGYTTDNEMESVAVAADGSRVVVSPYSTYGSPAYASSLGGAWTSCTGLPSGAAVAADRSSPATFYATYPVEWVYGGTVTVYESTNGGSSFSQVNTIPVNWADANGNGQWVIPRPVFGEPGEFWVSTYTNLYRFTNGGSSVTSLANVYEPMGPVGFGKAASGQTHPAVFLIGTVNGTYGFYRSDDGAGASWTQIMNPNQQYGKPGWAEGDETIYGRCYIGAGGRGIVYGDIAAVTPTNTATQTPTHTATQTATNTSTSTATQTSTNTVTHTATITSTNTATQTPTSTPTQTATYTPTSTAAITSTFTETPTSTATHTYSNTATNSVTNTSTDTATMTPTHTSTNTTTNSPTITSTQTATNTATNTTTGTVPATDTPTITFTNTASSTATNTSTSTSSSTATNTATNTGSSTATNSSTHTATQTATNTPTSTAVITSTFTNTVTNTASSTATNTPVGTAPLTTTNTPTHTSTNTSTSTATNTATNTASSTATSSSISTATNSATRTVTNTPTVTSTYSNTNTATLTTTNTPTTTATNTLTPQPASTLTYTPTITPTYTATITSVVVVSEPYPNPSTGSTITFNVQVPDESTVTLDVFTLAFRKIYSQTTQAYGFQNFQWDLRDISGTTAANGLYYVRLHVSGSESTTKIFKVLVLR